MPDAVLHQWVISPFCGKVRKLLRHKGIAFSVVNYNGLQATKVGSVSPTGKLPVLDFGGQRIHDSSAIAAFLESRVPEPPIYPAAPAGRARALVFEDWADESLYWIEVALRMGDPAVLPKAAELLCTGRPGWECGVVTTILRLTYPQRLKAQGIGRLPAERVHEMLFGHLDTIDAILAEGPWLVGAAKSIADLAVSAQIDEVVRTSPLAPRVLGYERIRDWLARCA